MFVRKLDVEDWRAYKALRLEALSLHGDVFGVSYEDDAARDDSYWLDAFRDGRHAHFGLFDGEEMVGITAVFTSRGDATGRTALLAASYIREAYRGRKLSRLLYEARIGWAKAAGAFDRIVVGHRDGNGASRAANQAFGFDHVGTEDMKFGDGTTDTHHTYEMRLR